MSSTGSAGKVRLEDEEWDRPLGDRAEYVEVARPQGQTAAEVEEEEGPPVRVEEEAIRGFERRNWQWKRNLARVQAARPQPLPCQSLYGLGYGAQPGYGMPGYERPIFAAPPPRPLVPTREYAHAERLETPVERQGRRLLSDVQRMREEDRKRKWEIEDEERRRKWKVEDEERRRKWQIEDEERRRKWQIEDEDRRRKWEIEEGRLTRDQRQLKGPEAPSVPATSGPPLNAPQGPKASRPATSGPPLSAPRGPKASIRSSFAAPGRGAMAVRGRSGSVHQGEFRGGMPARGKRWERNDRNWQNKRVRRLEKE
ncbi:MAG: hypothetical protein LQ351_001635 [Letrouitia transgressa]|nr:MAG: hypothetical protein LQ351_001635 [Letrouitia transgressa]